MPVPDVRILVVDDEPDILSSLTRFLHLRLRHATVTGAAGGGEAIELIDAERPDVVLSDYRMPHVSGLDVVRHAHDAGVAATMMITAYPDVDLARRALLDGHIVRFFVKPPDPAQIAASVQSVVDDLRAGMTRQAAFDRARSAMLEEPRGEGGR